MKKTPRAFAQAARVHQDKLVKVLSTGATNKMRKLYDEAQGALVQKLARTVRVGAGGTFTAYQQRMVLGQLRQGQAIITQWMSKQMTPLTKQAQEVALNGLVEDVARLSKLYTGSELVLPVEEASVFAGVVDTRAASLLRANQTSMARYGVNIVTEVEKDLSLSLLKGETPLQAVDKVAATIDGEWYQGERIVRTEMAYAFNSTHADGIEESAKEIPELMQRWEENCDDSGAPLDDRVGVDSIAMHGQVAPAGGVFTMPAIAPFSALKGKPTTQVSDSLVGLSWEFPPNRPNDRACLMPWMADWGIPGWRYVGGRRVPL